MITDQESIDTLTPLLKIIKDRQSMYFQAFAFIHKNIQSSSNDFDQIYIFNKFLSSAQAFENQLTDFQNKFLKSFTIGDELNPESRKIQSSSKQMMRLSVRVLEILQSSVERVRNSLFNDKGKLTIQFTRLKKSLHKIVKKDHIELYDFASALINFSKSKYRNQISKIKTYLKKLQTGDHVSLRDMYNAKDGSDVSPSPQDKVNKQKHATQKKLRNDQSGHSSSQSPHKRSSMKKVAAVRPKRTLNLKSTKKDESIEKVKEKPEKTVNANKLLKFYAMMELHKRQFLEDYIFEKQAEQEQKKKIFNSLIEKNKFNSEQIKEYRKKCDGFNPSTHTFQNQSSDQNTSIHRNQSSGGSRLSLRTSFIISKRKPSYTFQSPNTDKSDVEILPLSRTIKNLSSRKRTAQSNTPRNQSNSKNKSKKIFVVKSPMMFEDESIPKAQITQNKWMQAPLTGKDKSKKNEQLRLKKRNNPLPLDSNCLPQSFNLTQYPV